MKLLYESKYQILLHSEKDSMLISDWKQETKTLNEEKYLTEIHKLFSYFRRFKPLRYFCDISNVNTNLSEEAHAFTANLFKEEKAKFSAIVTNKIDIHPSVEAIVNELEIIAEDFVNRYFHDKTQGMNWLLNCGNGPTIVKSFQVTANQQ